MDRPADFRAVDALEMDGRDAGLLRPSWRWMTISGVPSRPICAHAPVRAVSLVAIGQ